MITTVRRIASLWRPHRLLALALAVTLLLRTAFTVVLALSVKLIIDRIVEGDPGGSASIIAVLVAGYAISAAAAVVAGYLEAQAGARILGDVRLAVFEHLQRLPVGFHTRSPVGDLMAHFSTDVAALQQGVVRQPRQALQSILAIGLFLPVMLSLEWRLALAAAVSLPLAAWAANRMAPATAPALDEEKRLVASMLEEVHENLQAQPVIRVFGLTRRATNRFREQIHMLQAGSTVANFRVSLLAATSEFAVLFVQLAIIGFGAALALNGTLAAGDFAAFVALLTEFAWETTVIASRALPEIERAASGIRRIDAVLAAGPLVDDAGGRQDVPAISESISFDSVAFSYEGTSERQLDAVSLRLNAGTTVAVVGQSGSGKSTLLNLLVRFYDPDEGTVSIDSVDLRSIDRAAYRQSVGVVFQDTFLFDTDIRENIRLARPDATDDEVVAAATAAGLADVMARLPDGLETAVGPSGRRLSGGQRQRIGIARAILRSPPLLLLDEVTSALDPVTEAAIAETIRRLASGRTIVSVTHRLQTVVDADHIVVMQHGEPVEQGTFAELRAATGHFSEMWEKQAGFEVSPDGRTGEITPERLRAIPLFGNIDDGLLERLAGQFAADHFVEGENVFRQGDPADRFHVIARGVAEVIRVDGGEEQVVAHLEDGDFFGEMAFLDDAPRNATVRAVTPTLTLSIDRAQFDELLEASPGAAAMVRDVAAARTAIDHA